MVVFWKRWDPPSSEPTSTKEKGHPPLLRYFNVFNVEQREGLGIPAFCAGPADGLWHNRRVTVTLRKWRAVFAVYFQDGLAYRAAGVIWILTDVVTAVTMPLVWAAASKTGPIAGFTGGDFVMYYLCMLLIGSVITSHLMWDIAMEIKEGQFSINLVRPIGFFQFCFFRNLAWRMIRFSLFLPFFLLLLFAYRGFLVDVHLHLGWVFWASVVLGHIVSFAFVMMMSMIALFVQETQSIFGFYYIPMMFLSGQLFPISLLPDWAESVAKLFPFYYTIGAPTEILVGRLPVAAAPGVLLTQLVWIGVCALLARVLWVKGLPHYTGVGM